MGDGGGGRGGGFFFCDNCLAKVVGEEMKTYLSCARIFWCERCKHDTTYSQKSF